MINPELNEKFQSQLYPGEKLLWTGKPKRFPLTGMGIFSFGFALVWCFFVYGIFFSVIIAVIFGIDSSAANESLAQTPAEPLDMPDEDTGAGMFGLIFLLFPLMFLLVGALALYTGAKLFFGPSRQIYAITNERGLVLEHFLGRRIGTISAQELKTYEKSGGDKVGTLKFGPGLSLFSMNAMFPKHPLNTFYNVANPRDVEILIRKQFAKKDTSHE